MLTDQSAIDAKLIYLEAESAFIPSGPSSDKRWTVYGSPVRLVWASRPDT